MSSDPKKWVIFLCEWEEVALMLQWKIYHFSSDFRANKRKFKLSSRSRASDTFQKKNFFSWDRHAVPKEGQNLRKRSFLWWFYSEKFTIFQAIPEIFFGNWLLDASATFRLWYLNSILSMVPKIGTKGYLPKFQVNKWTQSHPSTTSVRLFTGQVWRMR